MRKLILLFVLSVGIIGVSLHAGSSKHQDAAVVGPGPDAITNKIAIDVGPKPDVRMINVVAYEKCSQPTNLIAVDAGPGPTLIVYQDSNLLAAVVGPGPTLISNNIG